VERAAAPQCDDLERDGWAIPVAAALQPKSSLFANTGQFGHFGWSGVLRGASVVFFAFIGFEK